MEKFRFLLYLHRTWIVSEPYLLRTISTQKYLYMEIVRTWYGAGMNQVRIKYGTITLEWGQTYFSFCFGIDKHYFQRRKEFIPIITSEVTAEFIPISFPYFYTYFIPTLQQGQFFISSLVSVL